MFFDSFRLLPPLSLFTLSKSPHTVHVTLNFEARSKRHTTIIIFLQRQMMLNVLLWAPQYSIPSTATLLLFRFCANRILFNLKKKCPSITNLLDDLLCSISFFFLTCSLPAITTSKHDVQAEHYQNAEKPFESRSSIAWLDNVSAVWLPTFRLMNFCS